MNYENGLRPTMTGMRSGQNHFATSLFNKFRATPTLSNVTTNDSVFNLATGETTADRIVIRFNHASGDNKDLQINAFTADAEL